MCYIFLQRTATRPNTRIYLPLENGLTPFHVVVVTCSVIHVMSFLDEENMSSLIFYTDEAQALIVTDTLAVTDNGEPLSFVSKAGYIPQLRTIIAGTGAGGFSNTGCLKHQPEWSYQVYKISIIIHRPV